MCNTVTLGIRGDLNFLKKRMLEHPACSRFVSFRSDSDQNDMHWVSFSAGSDEEATHAFFGVIAESVIDRYELPLLRRILQEEHPQLSAQQEREALRNVSVYTDHAIFGYFARKQAVLHSLRDFFREDCDLSLDGFVAFRLRQYEELLSLLAAHLAEDCATRREYEDFINLLKYFVGIQEFRPSVTNIIVTPEGRYELLAEDGENITARCLSDFIDTDSITENTNFDDLLISMLITLAPQKILVHRAERIRNKELFQTIRRVFGGNMSYCSGCALCTTQTVGKRVLTQE